MLNTEEIIVKLQEKASQFSTEELDGLEEVKHNCPKCKDLGGTFGSKKDDENEKVYEIWIDCDCKNQRKINRLMKSSEITESFKQMGFTNFSLENRHQVIIEANHCAKTYFKNYESIKMMRTNSIALLGAVGAGKTHLLTALANNLIKKKLVSVLYFPYVEGFNDLRDDFKKLEPKLQSMKDVEVLFIDDLFKPVSGKPQASEWELKQVFSVINYRYLNHRPIIISSELSIDKMLVLDEALATRIAEMCEN